MDIGSNIFNSRTYIRMFCIHLYSDLIQSDISAFHGLTLVVGWSETPLLACAQAVVGLHEYSW